MSEILICIQNWLHNKSTGATKSKSVQIIIIITDALM